MPDPLLDTGGRPWTCRPRPQVWRDRPPFGGTRCRAARGPDIPSDGLSLEDNERSLLARALEKTNGNQTQAARLLRITRDTLRYKMKKFNLR